MSHLFYSSAFIAWWREIYPPTTFEDVFKLIAEDTKNQFIRAPVEVKQELEEKVDDSLTEWVKKQPDLFIPTQETVQETQRSSFLTPLAPLIRGELSGKSPLSGGN